MGLGTLEGEALECNPHQHNPGQRACTPEHPQGEGRTTAGHIWAQSGEARSIVLGIGSGRLSSPSDLDVCVRVYVSLSITYMYGVCKHWMYAGVDTPTLTYYRTLVTLSYAHIHTTYMYMQTCMPNQVPQDEAPSSLTYTHTHMHMHTHTVTNTYTYTYTHTPTHPHTRMHTHTHTCTHRSLHDSTSTSPSCSPRSQPAADNRSSS